MSRGDIRISDPGGKSVNPVRRFATVAAQGAILAGEPVKIQATVPKMYYVTLLADGDGVMTAASFYFVGIAAGDGTHTSSADGYVDVYIDLPGTVYRARALTAANADTQAEIDSRQFYRVVIDLTSSAFTLDASAADNRQNAFVIIGGDTTERAFDFVCAEEATWRNFGRRAA